MRRRSFLIATVFCTISLCACPYQDTYKEEAARLAKLMNWHEGGVVADIGAGEGQLSLDAAERVGATGHVYMTELDEKKLAHLEELANREKSHNITALKAGEADTNLPHECCDSIMIRRVYHHFTQPAKIDASIFQSLKPGGMLAVIDFPPRAFLPKVEGVPENRGGHGIPQRVLIDELTAAGFQVVSSAPDWPNDDYCVIFRKPEP